MFRLLIIIGISLLSCLFVSCTPAEKGIPLEEFNRLQATVNATALTINSKIMEYSGELIINDDLTNELISTEQKYTDKENEINTLEITLNELNEKSIPLEQSIGQTNIVINGLGNGNKALLERLLLEYEDPPGIKLLNQVVSFDTWNMESSQFSTRWLSLDAGTSMEAVAMHYYLGNGGGSTGTSDIKYLPQFSDSSWAGIDRQNSIVYFNPQRATFTELFDLWPEQYIHILPFSHTMLEQISPPFVLVEKDIMSGKCRLIMVASSETQVMLLTRALMGNDIPIGVPWTYEE